MARYHFRDVEDQRDERSFDPRPSEYDEPEPVERPDLEDVTFERRWYDEPAAPVAR